MNETESVERKLHSWEEGNLVSLLFSPGKLLNQMEFKKADLHEKLEVCATGNVHACFTEVSHQAEETTLCLLLSVAC